MDFIPKRRGRRIKESGGAVLLWALKRNHTIDRLPLDPPTIQEHPGEQPTRKSSISEEVRRRVERVRRPSLPVIAQEDDLCPLFSLSSTMNSVGRRARRPSLADWTEVMNRYNSMELDERRFEPNNGLISIEVQFPEIDGPHVLPDRVAAMPGKKQKLGDVLEGRLRQRGLSVENVAFFLEGSSSPIPEDSDVQYLSGHKIIVRRRSTMRVARHTRAAHSMEEPQERPRRKISEDAVSRKTSFVNAKMLAKSRQQSDSRSGNGSEELLDFSRSRDSSQRDLSHLDEPSCSDNLSVDDGGTRRARSTTSSRISLFFGKEKTEMLSRLNSLKESNRNNRLVADLELEEHWTQIVKNYQSLPKSGTEKQEAIWEIVTTEQRYIYLMKNLVELDYYFEQLQRQKFFTDVNRASVFLNYGELLGRNLAFWRKAILPMLEYSRSTGVPLDPTYLLQGFEDIEEWSKCYIPFNVQQKHCYAYVVKKTKEHELFREFLTWAESQEWIRRQKFTDTLSAPMQQITRYRILLLAVVKSSMDEGEKNCLQAMIDRTEMAISQLDNEMNNNHLRQNMRQFMDFIESYDCVDHDEFDKLFPGGHCVLDLMAPMPMLKGEYFRSIHMRGDLKMKEGKGPKVDIHCVIFTDMVLLCKSMNKRGDKLRIVKPPMHINNVLYHPSFDQMGFHLILMNEFKTPTSLYTMHCSTVEETRRWLEMLHNTSKEFAQLQQHLHYSQFEMRDMRYDMRDMRRGPFDTPTGSMPSIVHRKSSSMDSQVVAAHAHLQHMARKTTVSSTEQLDRHLAESPSRMPPRHKLSVASCHAAPISQSKSSVDLHLGTNGNDRVMSPEPVGRSRSNSTGPEVNDVGRSRTPSPTRADSRSSRLNPRESSPLPPSPEEHPTSNSPALLVTSTEDEDPPQSGSGRRFEKRYHTHEGIELVKPKGSAMPTGILKRFSWNVSSAVGSSSRKINSRLMEQHSRRHSQSSTVASVASSESFGSSTSGISSSGSHAENGHDDDITLKSHISTICVGEMPSDGETLSISFDSPKSTPTAEFPAISTPPSVQTPPIVCTPPQFEEPILLQPASVQYPQTPMKAEPLLPSLPPPPPVCHENISDSKHRELLKLIMDNRLETSDV